MVEQKVQKQNYRNVESRFTGRMGNWVRPKWLVKTVINTYIRHYKIDMTEYEIPEGGFQTFNQFFTRKIKPSLRPINEGIVSPVDGSIFDSGFVDDDHKIFVKHKHYYTEDLLCEDFKGLSSYVVLYLAPSNYHRVHACFDMHIHSVSYLPGTLMSVKEKVVYKKDRVYCRNERIVVSGDSDYGMFYFVLVGALLVGKVKLSFDNDLCTNIKRGIYTKKHYDKPVVISKGDEVGLFEMGSSVIILSEKDFFAKINKNPNKNVVLGETILKA